MTQPEALAGWIEQSANGLSDRTETRKAEPHGDSAQVDGHRMHFIKAGFGSPVVLIHGLLGSARCWHNVLPLFARIHTVYALDAIGSGESDRVPTIDPGLEATADRLIAFLDALRLRRVDIVATSHGGAVAMMAAARCPSRIRSLVLHAPANPFSTLGDPLIRFYKTWLGTWFAQLIPTLPRKLQDLSLGRMYGNTKRIREGTLERYMPFLAVPGTIEHQLGILYNWFDDMEVLRGEIPKIRKVPISLLWGTRDRAVSVQSGIELERQLDKAKLTLMPGSGHIPYEECPEEFGQLVMNYLREIDREWVEPIRTPQPAGRRSKKKSRRTAAA